MIEQISSGYVRLCQVISGLVKLLHFMPC